MKNLTRRIVAMVLMLVTLLSIGIMTPAQAATGTIVSASEISSAASSYGIPTSSRAYTALQRINNYYSQLSGSTNGTLIFFFEGVGNSSSASQRLNAMCVVVKAGKIKYINCNSSTIPDYPFTPSKNEGTPMPTVKSGVHSFTTVNHKGKYAALNITNAPVVRHRSTTDYYSSTSTGINIHRRSSDSIAPSGATWVNSSGCLLVGKTPNLSSTTSEYAKFIKAVGIVGSSATASSTYTTKVSGKVVVDRYYADSYFSAVGYTSGARSLLGTNPSQPASWSVNFRMKSAAYFNAYSAVNGSYVGRVYPNDVIRVKTVYESGWMCVECPWGSSTKTVYIRTNGFQFKATKYINAYSSSTGSGYVGRVYPNDIVTVQEIYRSGYMRCTCAWTGGITKTIYLKCTDIY